MDAPREVNYETDNGWRSRSCNHVERHVIPGVFRLSSRCNNRPAPVVRRILRIDAFFMGVS
jgi:hypothetical protein